MHRDTAQSSVAAGGGVLVVMREQQRMSRNLAESEICAAAQSRSVRRPCIACSHNPFGLTVHLYHRLTQHHGWHILVLELGI